MEELRWALLLLGGCAIVAILVHGIWSVRKNNNEKKQSSLELKRQSEDDNYADEISQDPEITIIDADIRFDETAALADDSEEARQQALRNAYDDLGLGEVRIVSSEPEKEPAQGAEPVEDIHHQAPPEPQQQCVDENLAEMDEVEPEKKIYASVVSQPKPEYLAEQEQMQQRKKWNSEEIPEPPPSLLKAEQQVTPEQAQAEPVKVKPQAEPAQAPKPEPQQVANETVEKPARASLSEQAMNLVKGKKAEAGTRKRREPKIAEDQMRIDFDDPSLDEPKVEPKTEAEPQPQEVLVLNVKAPDSQPIPGAALLPMLLTLGFKFGDQDIFHRHVNSNGKGPVLFSLANMFKPGVFDIDNLENFTTQGVSLFMILPIEGDPHQVFNMMHNAARKIADEFGADVLDGRRSTLTKQSLQQYVEKIREFERKRMLSR